MILAPVSVFVRPVIVFIPIFLYFGKSFVDPKNLDPITISASFFWIGSIMFSISDTTCCPSE